MRPVFFSAKVPLKRQTMARVSPNAHADCECGSSTSSGVSVGAVVGDGIGAGIGSALGAALSVGDGVGIGVGTKLGENDDETMKRGDLPSSPLVESMTCTW